ENQYLEQVLEPVKELRELLFDEMKGRIQQDEQSVPYLNNGYWYYTRHEIGKEYAIYCRKRGGATDVVEEIILDVNELAEGQKFCDVKSPKVSPDNQLAVYAMDLSGRNLHRAFVKHLGTGAIIEQDSPVLAGEFVWTPDSKAFFYDTKDLQTLRTDKVWLHHLGQDFTRDVLVYHETDETSYAHISQSKDHVYLFIHSGYTENVECQYISLADYLMIPVCIKPRSDWFYYSLDHHEGYFYILTNDQARNFRLMRAPVNQYQYEHWEEFIPHHEDILIDSLDVFKDWLVLFERKDGLNQMHVIPWSDLNAGHYIRFRDASYDCWFGANYEVDTDVLRLGYTSLTTPMSTYQYDMNSRELVLLKERVVLGGFNKEDYQSEYLQVPARDGEQIPISMVYRKGFQRNGEAPALLYAYGSYGINNDPHFSSNILSLLDRGFVYVIAHIRGGKEKGWSWYEDGKLLKKINSFNDYIDCAEYLVQQQYTRTDRLFGRGGSAGGLLMGAVYNMRPDLFKGLLAHVPFVDVLTTMLDPDIPLTTGEYTEWGNPNDSDAYAYMKLYSPIDNVETRQRTNLLVTTGFSDSQVQYWEPAKWVAKLRRHRVDPAELILFYTNLDAGHGGASGRFERLREIALEFAFILGLLKDQ
ncbi:MAG TPA: S9 family peptidase, partial [Saprospiraceae bacterium]|nr:S9 family peptidase [Saprospiraceae bacterium]